MLYLFTSLQNLLFDFFYIEVISDSQKEVYFRIVVQLLLHSLSQVFAVVVVEAKSFEHASLERFACEGGCSVFVSLSFCRKLTASFDIVIIFVNQYIENDGCLLWAESWVEYPVKWRLDLIDSFIKCLVVLGNLSAVYIFFPLAWSRKFACFIHWKAFT